MSTRTQHSRLSSGQLKQALMQTPTKPAAKKDGTQLTHRCPSKIHCTNCGHNIDLKAYIEKFHATKDNLDTAKSSRSELIGRSSVSVSNSGLTAFDLEKLCDSGCFETSSLISADGRQQLMQQNVPGSKKSQTHRHPTVSNLLLFPEVTTFPETYHRPSYQAAFPHSDSFTTSFAPVVCDSDKEDLARGKCLEKVDSLDVEEMLQLLQAPEEVDKHYFCERRQDNYQGQRDGVPWTLADMIVEQKQFEFVQTANHITSEQAMGIPCNGEVSGKTAYIQPDTEVTGKFDDGITDSTNVKPKPDCSNVIAETADESTAGRVLRSRLKQRCRLRICKFKPKNISRQHKKKQK